MDFLALSLHTCRRSVQDPVLKSPLGQKIIDSVFKNYARLKAAFDAGLGALKVIAAGLKDKAQQTTASTLTLSATAA